MQCALPLCEKETSGMPYCSYVHYLVAIRAKEGTLWGSQYHTGRDWEFGDHGKAEGVMREATIERILSLDYAAISPI